MVAGEPRQLRYYDGSAKWEQIEARLQREGFALDFSCAYFDKPPSELRYTGRENGWEMRRKLKAYCLQQRIADYRIVRNTSYHRDLHGVVYQLWTRSPKE